VRPAQTSRALHVLTRLLGASALGLALVAGDAALAPAALAAPTIAAPSAAPLVAKPRAKKRVAKAKPITSKRSAKKSSRARTTRRAGDVLRRTPVTRRPVTKRAASRPAEPVVAALPAFVLPDLASLLPGDSSAPGPRVAQADAAPRRPFTSLGRSASALLDAMVERARSQLGTRYVLGGASPGRSLDCSSFARYAMEALGVALPRTANQQAQVGTPVPRDRNALRPGDLLTFGTRRTVDHVGIYLGEGRFIHASVKSGQVIETTIERNGLLFRKWQGARRLIASDDTARMTGG
jgi:cell wall-associated NlpC family hydrolase